MKRRKSGVLILLLLLAPAARAQKVPVQEFLLDNGMKLLMVPQIGELPGPDTRTVG